LAWLAVIGLDFLLNAGVLAPFYDWERPGLLPPSKMFQYIPLGYASFLFWSIVLVWLLARTHSYGAAAGARFGAKLGALLGGAAFLGGLSIYAFPPLMQFCWAVAQALIFTLAGAVIGASLTARRLRPAVGGVLAFVAACLIITVAMQNLGLTPVHAPQGHVRFGPGDRK
jgi:hypothetical protein